MLLVRFAEASRWGVGNWKLGVMQEPPDTAGGSCHAARKADLLALRSFSGGGKVGLYRNLSADLEVGSATRAAVRAAAKDVAAGDKLDPQRTVALVVRSGVGLAQRIQAVLRRTRRCGGESRQLEHHPRTGIQFRHGEVQVWPFGGDLVLGARSYVGCAVRGELLA